MPLALEAHFWWQRAQGLWRRGVASLRTRGFVASWQRLRLHFRHAPRPATHLYAPATTPFAPFALPTSHAPQASVVIPVHGAWAHTLACLRALAAHPPSTPFEVLVVDDASPDASLHYLGQISGLRVHARPQNGGFIAACNDGAALAQGQYLIFLNNDTVPQPGWLEALLHTFKQHPGTGLAGAQLVYPDGRLQEAGGVVFADGGGWNYGRGEDPSACQYQYVRDADYLSGAAIAIPAPLFRQLGGFDVRFAPAYYEDTDLAFQVRAAGLRVLYQPASVVVHDEGSSAGTDLHCGPKAAQVRNKGVFAAKWRLALAAQLPAGTLPTPALLHRRQRQVLIVDATTPQPDRDSGSLRLLGVIQLLLEEGAHVVFVPANHSVDGAYTRALQALGVECWYGPQMPRWPVWLREHGPRFHTVMVCRHYVATELFPLLRTFAPQARLLFDTVDLHYLREQRAAQMQGDAAGLRAAAQTRQIELGLMVQADATLVVSTAEQALLAHECPQAQVDIVSNVHALAPPGPGWAQRAGLLFVGGFRHPPNVDAMHWFATEVFPLLRRQRPDLQLHCIGADAPEAVTTLATLPGVHVHGHVPDLQPWLQGCRVSLAPLRYGAGVKGKVNQAMAHGLPVVATACAVEGMHLEDGRDVLVADTAEGFANAVLRLHDDAALWAQLAQRGRDNVAQHFSFEAARPTVRRLFLG
jgi:GT2 family glycosyltransferase